MTDFTQTLDAVRAALHAEQRISYRMLKRRFALSDEDIEDIRSEFIDAKRIAIDEDGKVLVWAAGELPQTPPLTSTPASYTPAHLAARIRSQQQALEARGDEGERKTITVLFSDLKGSTALLEALDPEVARAIIDPALQVMMNAVHRYEGYVAQALGDGILALFGAPLAHEDHAQRAVFAALHMQDEMAKHADHVRLRHGVSLATRVGLNTGEVVLRSIRKDDLHTDYVPVGHSINLAARMEQMAAPGSILVSEATARLVDGYFALKNLGTADIKGVEQPQRVFEVTGVGALRTRLQVAASRGLTRFVGRHHELAQLQQAFELARAGRGQIIGIMGEPGMGKSRLVHEFKTRAHGCAIFEAYSASHGKASPYLPISELLKAYFQIQLQDDERTRREKVLGKLLALDRSLEDVLPYYFSLLNIDAADSPLPQLDPQVRRRRTFEALKKVTLRVSLEQPVLLIFEDLHWIDSETQGFLDALADSIGNARIMLLTNYRPEYRHDWGARSYCTQLRLAPFGRAEAEEFLDSLLGSTVDAPSASGLVGLRTWILEKTEGTPFFMEEVVQELFERDLLHRGTDGALGLRAPAVANIQIPTTVQGVLAARIDRLTPNEKALLQQLAVIGREFPFSLAREVVGLSEDALHQTLNALQKKEFLYEQPSFPEVEYLFKHALTQEVAYLSLLQERRKDIHERTARAIEAAYAAELDDHYSNLAHHYSRSGNTDKAIEYLEKAGVQAARRAAHSEAVNHLQAALALLRDLPDVDQRQTDELRMLFELSGPVRVTCGMTSPEIEAICDRALALCELVGTLADTMRIQLELRVLHCVRGDARTAEKHADRLHALAQADGNRLFLANAHGAMCVTRFILGQLRQTQEHAAQTLAHYDMDDARWHAEHIGYDPSLLVIPYAATARAIEGYPMQAMADFQRAQALAQQLANPYMHGFVGSTFGWMLGLLREHPACIAATESTIALAQEYGFPEWIVWSSAWLGHALAQTDAARGVQLMAQALEGAGQARAEFGVTSIRAALAEVCLESGRVVEASSNIEQALSLAGRNHEHLFLAELHRVHGRVLLTGPGHRGDREAAAEAAFETAIRLAQEQRAKWWELRATLNLAELRASQGRRREGHERLRPVHDWFTEGAELADLRAARALLAN